MSNNAETHLKSTEGEETMISFIKIKRDSVNDRNEKKRFHCYNGVGIHRSVSTELLGS